MRSAGSGTFAPGDEAINDTDNNSGWHLLAENTFQGSEVSADHPAVQVEALLNKALATLSLPDALIHTISTRLIQAVDHSGRANPSTVVTFRMYIQKPKDLVNHPGGNGWGYFLVERYVKNPTDPTGVSDHLIEVYLYPEGEGR